ncbi:MAG: prolyl oligopeptidase family serine peptidase [Phycisphaerales bacterium]|nr:prolyl oligopeptidase family serine peptidase [Phycisphaerales bacterium]
MRWGIRPLVTIFSVALALGWLTDHSARLNAQSSAPSTPVLASCFEAKSIRVGAANDGAEYKYAVFVPNAYRPDGDKKWPLILFLHGSGECGDDGVRQTSVGLPRQIERRRDDFPFITVMPQAHTLWFTGEDEMAVWQMLEATAAAYRIDMDRIYITGLSMGGFATWDFISKRPDVFAAAAPICGVGNPAFVSNEKNLPIWAFHGAKDPNVPVSGSRDAIEALRTLGAQPKYTEYSDGEHNVWDLAYSGNQLYDWFLEHKRPPTPSKIEYRMQQSVAHVWWLRLRAESTAKTPPLISAEIKDGELNLLSQGVADWFLASSAEPIAPDSMIRIRWNNLPVYEGKFPGIIRVIPPQAILPSPTNGQSSGASSRPTEASR